MNRADMLASAWSGALWDIAVIGGGATGLGIAVDAASRGCRVILLEGADFAQGTSSRSTKLVHGGVRYLQQGNVSLVMEALRERGIMRRNAPHLVHDLAFIVPSYEWWQSPFYGLGLRVYDMLAGRYGFGRSTNLSRRQVVEAIPSIQQEGLKGGTRYFDGQFDDARFALALAQTAADEGATVLNYARVTGFLRAAAGELEGLHVRDEVTGDAFELRARIIVNATGPFSDSVRRMDHPDARPLIAPSRGSHVVLDRAFLPNDSAIMVPHTSDGRVMFAIPWLGVAVIGTTDIPVDRVDPQPQPSDDEINFILDTANRYLARPAARSDIRSVFAGIRPLVHAGVDARTASLSREHTIVIDPQSGLITIAGGKWTTYRKMAEDVVDQAVELGSLEAGPCRTETLRLHGAIDASEESESDSALSRYGSDAPLVAVTLAVSPSNAELIHPDLPLTVGEVEWFCQREMAITIDDVLSRRSRCTILNARAACRAAPLVAQIMRRALARNDSWVEAQLASFDEVVSSHTCPE